MNINTQSPAYAGERQENMEQIVGPIIETIVILFFIGCIWWVRRQAKKKEEK